MLAYWCEPCRFLYREIELRDNKRCPECKATCTPRLILAGQIMGAQS